jgi:hypothetical protein
MLGICYYNAPHCGAYTERTNRNFNTRFKELRKDFRYAERKSKFSEHVGVLS